ncbi:MAG: Na(+)-translocating NADH-quinone reductase subunit C [Halospina sp.]
MSQSNDTVSKILIVAVTLSIVFSVIVSGAAVTLRPAQDRNEALSTRSNMLAAAGVLDVDATNEEIAETFDRFEVMLVEMGTGELVSAEEVNAESAASFDARGAARDPELSRNLTEDPAGINRQVRYNKAYVLRDGDEVERVVLPIHGYGLWSIMYGFLALEGDGSTVAGVRFYEHAETPGLGGEIENPDWLAKWEGKKIYDEGEYGNPNFAVVKGGVSEDSPGSEHKIDALSGATLTSRGVESTVNFWLGERGYGPFLARVRKGEI